MSHALQLAKELQSRFPDLQADEDRLNPWLQSIRSAIYNEPVQTGHADALFTLGTAFGSGLTLNHDYETFTLMVYALRSTLNNKSLEFDILVNLCHACLYQKSFEEAYQYGKLAETNFGDQDVDLLANMIIASTVTNRIAEAKQKSEKLKKLRISKLEEVNEILKGRGPLRPTKDEDCADALADLKEALRLWQNNKDDQAVTKIRESVVKLAKWPDGLNAWKCWQMLAEFYVSQSSRPTQLETIEYYARAAAALGKLIAFYPEGKELEPKYWLWHGQSLCELDLIKFATNSLEKALSIQTRDKSLSQAIRDTLEYCRQSTTHS